VRASPPLELREDPEAGVTVAGLSRNTVTSAAEVMALLQEGNSRRKTDSTDANAASSRSHAVRAAAAGPAGGQLGPPWLQRRWAVRAGCAMPGYVELAPAIARLAARSAGAEVCAG
jgi:hypothetical protein